MSDELSKIDELKLTGRIYPSIKSCVDNRYKIVISFFAYYAFIINVKIQAVLSNITIIQLIMSMVFTLFIFHNYYNYTRNANAQQKIEKPEKPQNWFSMNLIEIIFGFIMLITIWLAFVFIKFDC